MSASLRRPLIRALVLVSTLLATGSVHADRYPPCPLPDAPQLGRWAVQEVESFAPIGTWWFPVAMERSDFDPRCAWSPESGERVAANIQLLHARPDWVGTKTWLRVSSEGPLDPRQRWRLICEWRFSECERPGPCLRGFPNREWMQGVIFGPECHFDSCAGVTWSSKFVPIVPTTNDAAGEEQPIALHVEGVALEHWVRDGKPLELLQLWIEPLPEWFWARGGVLLVHYPDGRWTLAAPNPSWPRELALLPGPKPGERSLDLQLIDGENRVVDAETLEIGSELWEQPRPGPQCFGPPTRGCRR